MSQKYYNDQIVLLLHSGYSSCSLFIQSDKQMSTDVNQFNILNHDGTIMVKKITSSGGLSLSGQNQCNNSYIL